MLTGGNSVPLSSIASVRMEVAQPPVGTAWMNQKQVVAVGITVARDKVNTVEFGRHLRRFSG